MEKFLGCNKSYEQADTVIFGAPFDATTSYRPGARFGSRVMRAESYALETYSPYLDKDVETDKRVCDLGEIELCFGDAKAALDAIEAQAEKILNDGKRPLMIGGEHLVSLGAIRAAAKKYPELRVIHFDAHTDLRGDYLGAALSHATVMRRVWELIGDGRIYSFGIRSGDREEFIWAAQGHVQMSKFDFAGLKETVLKLLDMPVYFTIDLDVLDPAVFPGTGTAEPGGVAFMQLLEAVYEVCRLNLVACDLVELAPALDPSGASTSVANKVLRELLLAMK